MSKSNPTVKKSSRHASKTAISRTPQSGPIYVPSTAQSWKGWLTSLREASPASPTASQDSNGGPVMNATSGLRRSALSVRWDHDMSYWKTYQVSFLYLLTGESQRMGEPWLESLPPSGTVSIGKQSELTIWAHPTDVSGGGASAWLTPRANDPNEDPQKFNARMGDRGPHNYGSLTAQVQWPTPNASDQYNPNLKDNHDLDKDYLRGVAATWPSPQAMDSIHRSQESFEKIMNRPRQGKMLPKLADVAHQENWPTPDSSPRGPRAEDLMVDGKMQVQRRESGQQRGMDLQTATTHWPTPTATERSRVNPNTGQGAGLSMESKNWATPQQRDHRSAEGIAPRWANPQRSRNLNDQVYSNSQPGPQAPQTETDGSESSESGQTSPQPSPKRLNPSFVEWIMGVPIGWTNLTECNDYERWETASFQLWQQSFSGQYHHRSGGDRVNDPKK